MRTQEIGPTTLYLVTLFSPHCTPYNLNLTSPYTLPLSPASLVPATGLLEGQILQVFSVLSPAAEACSVYQRLYLLRSVVFDGSMAIPIHWWLGCGCLVYPLECGAGTTLYPPHLALEPRRVQSVTLSPARNNTTNFVIQTIHHLPNDFATKL
jgi:hypothetical protein